MELVRRVSRGAGALCLAWCSGCGGIIEGLLFNAAMVGMFAIFAPLIVIAAIAHLASAIALGRARHRPEAFGRLATAWLLISVGVLVAVMWLQIEFPTVADLQRFFAIPASTFVVGFLAAYTSSRLSALAARDDAPGRSALGTAPPATDEQPLPPVPVGPTLRIANLVAGALPLVAAAASGAFGERLALGSP